MSDNKLYAFIWIVILVLIVSITKTCGDYSLAQTKYYTENNYCEVKTIGTHETIWTKCKEKK